MREYLLYVSKAQINIRSEIKKSDADQVVIWQK